MQRHIHFRRLLIAITALAVALFASMSFLRAGTSKGTLVAIIPFKNGVAMVGDSRTTVETLAGKLYCDGETKIFRGGAHDQIGYAVTGAAVVVNPAALGILATCESEKASPRIFEIRDVVKRFLTKTDSLIDLDLQSLAEATRQETIEFSRRKPNHFTSYLGRGIFQVALTSHEKGITAIRSFAVLMKADGTFEYELKENKRYHSNAIPEVTFFGESKFALGIKYSGPNYQRTTLKKNVSEVDGELALALGREMIQTVLNIAKDTPGMTSVGGRVDSFILSDK